VSFEGKSILLLQFQEGYSMFARKYCCEWHGSLGFGVFGLENIDG
jgi:hypothetical protein